MSVFSFGSMARDDGAHAIEVASLVESYAALLFRVAHSVLRNSAEAEDAVQDTFVRVIEHQHDLPGIRDLRPWLVRITWNLALDRRRKLRPEQIDGAFAATLVAPDTPADVALEESQRTRAVLRSIDSLPRAERQVLLLASVEELSTPEIAAVMSKSESAVRALLFRARQHLRERAKKGGNA